MATVRVIRQPSGCINGNYWPEPGGELELPDQVAEDMAAAGWLEVVEAKKVEKRPASRKGVETRKGRASLSEGRLSLNEVRELEKD